MADLIDVRVLPGWKTGAIFTAPDLAPISVSYFTDERLFDPAGDAPMSTRRREIHLSRAEVAAVPTGSEITIPAGTFHVDRVFAVDLNTFRCYVV
jgi:hypothetical protein